MGYNPQEFRLHLKSLEGRVAEINGEIKDIENRLGEIENELNGLKEPEMPENPPKDKEIPEYKSLLPIDTTGFTVLQNEYYDKLTTGNAEEMLKKAQSDKQQAENDVQTLVKDKETLTEELKKHEETVNKQNDVITDANNKLAENAKKQFTEEKFAFEGENKLKEAEKAQTVAEKELDEAKKEREALVPQEKPQECETITCEALSEGEIELIRKECEEKKEELNKLNEENEITRGKLDGRDVEKYAVSDDEAEKLSAEIKAFDEEEGRLNEEEKKFEELPKDITKQIARNEKEIAENDADISDAEKGLAVIVAGIAASKEAKAKLKETDGEYKRLRRLAGEERKFASSAEAKKVVKKFNDGVGKLLNKMTDGRLSAKLEDCLRITENGEVIALSWLGSTDKMLIYVACIKNAPVGDEKISNSLVVCGDVDMDKELFVKSLEPTTITLKTSVEYVLAEKPAKKRKTKTATTEQPEEPVKSEETAKAEDAAKPETKPAEVTEAKPEEKAEEHSEVKAEQAEEKPEEAKKEEATAEA